MTFEHTTLPTSVSDDGSVIIHNHNHEGPNLALVFSRDNDPNGGRESAGRIAELFANAPKTIAQRDALEEALKQVVAAKQAVLMTPGTGVPINLAVTIDKAARLLASLDS